MVSQAAGMEAVRLGEAGPVRRVAEADAALAECARGGDVAAFEQLYLRHRDQVYTLCLNLCGNPEEANDLLQETFVRAYRALPRFRGAAQFTTWLHRIAVNLCHDAARQRREATHLSPDPTTADPSARETAAAVRAALGRLRPAHRIVLVLRYSQSLSYQEIAEMLHWSLPRVKVTIHRAKRAFRDVYLEMGEAVP